MVVVRAIDVIPCYPGSAEDSQPITSTFVHTLTKLIIPNLAIILPTCLVANGTGFSCKYFPFEQ